jgi:hypothetical protein
LTILPLREWSLLVVSLALLLTPGPAPGVVADSSNQQASDVALKAAIFFNFAKFTEWPALSHDAPLIACVVGDDGIAAAFVEAVRGHKPSERRFDLRRSQDSATWRTCHLLFIAGAEPRRPASGLAGVATLPVLTVSDSKGFALAGGIIELYVEGRQMRFAINVDAAERSGLQLSSRLLGLAKIIRETR